MNSFFNTLKENFLKILEYDIITRSFLTVFLIYVLFINIKTYFLFVKDKKYAIENKERISEAKLLKYCFLGGALGGFLGMKTAHHKTRKWLFSIGVPLMLVIQTLIISFLCGFFGFGLYMQ